MNFFKIEIKNIQHIKSLKCEFDLSNHGLHCIVGKNGVGKTTFIKVLQNFKETNFLDKSSRINIIKKDSYIEYQFNEEKFRFDSDIIDSKYILDTKAHLNQDIQNNIFTELPLPKGKRFNAYDRLGEIADDFRQKFALSEYIAPIDLIDIFKEVYQNDKFENLKEIKIGDISYYILPLDEQNYIREDDFSSGEYMLIQIYKLIQDRNKLIVIDEIDISLDAAAQVRFMKVLDKLAKKYELNIIFTVHSLAIMKVFSSDGIDGYLYYMEEFEEQITIEKCSYNFIKAELFQFIGYDKIILTEDKMLFDYIEYLLKDESFFNTYRIIPCGGFGETLKIQDTNKNHNILGTKNVKIVLDNDKFEKYKDKEFIYFIPFDDIEMECLSLYRSKEIENFDEIDTELRKIPKEKDKSKFVVENLQKNNKYTLVKLFEIINNNSSKTVEEFKKNIVEFLNSVE